MRRKLAYLGTIFLATFAVAQQPATPAPPAAHHGHAAQPAQSPDKDLNSAINKSGRQRMLSQRMTKAYCRIGLNIRRDEAEKQLSDAIPLFERQLADLKAFFAERTD